MGGITAEVLAAMVIVISEERERSGEPRMTEVEVRVADIERLAVGW